MDFRSTWYESVFSQAAQGNFRFSLPLFLLTRYLAGLTPRTAERNRTSSPLGVNEVLSH